MLSYRGQNSRLPGFVESFRVSFDKLFEQQREERFIKSWFSLSVDDGRLRRSESPKLTSSEELGSK